MKIIVVGGAGDMGQVACETVAIDPVVTQVIIADRDIDRARALADKIGSKASAISLDITDKDSLLDAVSKADIVLNTVGPFYLYGPPVLEAAIAAGKHYADIADDWEPTLAMLDLDEAARDAGITAVIGIGASPGISNLLASAAHAELDTVESLHTVWRGGSGVPPVPATPEEAQPSAAIDHWIHNLAEPIRLWRDGRYEMAEALETFEIVYPGIGPGQVWTCGHPEPITLPRAFPDITNSYNIMFARPGLIEAARAVRDRVRDGEIDVAQGSKEFLLSPGRRWPEAGEIPAFPGVFAYAEGTKDGAATRVAVMSHVLPEGEMGEITCVPLAIAAGMLARGEALNTGVHAPEGALDPGIFFERLEPFAADLDGKPRLEVSIEAM